MACAPPGLCERLLASRWFAPLALCVLGALLYGGTVRHEFTTWDDDVYVTRNPVVTDPSWEAVAALFTRPAFYNYHPLTILSYMGEHALVGDAPWLYHLDNVLLHIAASLLAYGLLRHWLGVESSRLPALLAAILFLAHPLRVESVAWVAERKDVLCGALYLASLLAYMRHLDSCRGGARRLWGLSFVLFLLAALSKVMAVTLPAVLVLVLLSRRQVCRHRLLGVLPFAGVAVIFAIVGVLAQAEGGGVKGLHGGSLLTHVLTVFKAVAHYAEKLLLPVLLSPRYMLAPAQGLFEPQVVAGILLAAAGAWAAWGSFHGERRVLLGVGFFAVVWAPVSGIAPSSTIVADRYLYLPALGLFLLAGACVCAPAGRSRFSWRRIAAGIAVVGVLACLAITPRRAEAWRTSTALWTDALRENPSNPFAYNQLSMASLEAGRAEEAAVLAAEAGRHGLGHVEYALNLCYAYRAMGDRAREANTARSIVEAYPDCLPAWLVILRHHIDDGAFDEAVQLFERLASQHGEAPSLVAMLSRLEERRGNLEAALGLVLRSIELERRNAETLLSASVLLARLGDAERAIANAERAAALPGAILHPGARERIAELDRILDAEGAAAPRTASRAKALAAKVGVK